MGQRWHDILIAGDEGDRSFSDAAPFVVEALEIIFHTRLLHSGVGVECDSAELSTIKDDHLAFRVARKDVEALRGMMATLLESAHDSLLTLQAADILPDDSAENAVNPGRSLLSCDRGLVSPRILKLNPFLRSHPTFDYKVFRAKFERLCQIVADARLFSACEPRVKILQSRYRLYRAFNMRREEHFHPTLGPGNLRRAPKTDVRRVGTCMSASSVVDFVQKTVSSEPNLVLSTSSVLSTATDKGRARNPIGRGFTSEVQLAVPQQTFSMPTKDSGTHDSTGERTVTLKALADAFFGPSLPPQDRVFTMEGLGLRLSSSKATSHTVDILEARDEHHTAANAVPILRQFLDVYSGNGGALLGRLVTPMISRISRNKKDVLEVEFTVTGHRPGEVQHIASWCVRSGFFVSGGNWPSLRITMRPSAGDGGECTAKSMEDVLKHIFEPIWLALLCPEKYPDVAQLFRRLVSVSVLVSGESGVQEMPTEGDPAMYSVEKGDMPPSSFFIYHVWRNVQLLNCFIATHVVSSLSAKEPPTSTTEDVKVEFGNSTAHPSHVQRPLFQRYEPLKRQPLRFRLYTSGTRKKTFAETVIGLLVTDQVVGPLEVLAWSSLTYFYYLTQRSIVVTPYHTYDSTPYSMLKRAIPFAVETGLRVSVSTIDPLYFHTNEEALNEELNGIMKIHQVSTPEVMEICLNSAGYINFDIEKRCKFIGGPWRRVSAQNNNFTVTQVNSLRLRFRELSLTHEMDLLFRKGLTKWGGHSESKRLSEDFLVHGGWSLLATGSSASTSAERRRENLWRFFDIPPLPEKVSGAMTMPGSGRRLFVDKLIKFPRIVVLGPRGRKRSEARCVVEALQRREYYKAFTVHYELAASLASLAGTAGVEALLASQRSSRSSGRGFTSTEKWREHHDKGEQTQQPSTRAFGNISSSIRSFSSPVVREQGVTVPTTFCFRDGVRDVVVPANANATTKEYFRPLPSWAKFQADARQLRALSSDSSMLRYANRRLDMLECKFNLHVALTNDDQETQEGHLTDMLREKSDIYKCVKVDVHCHMASGMTAKELLKFIKEKVRMNRNDVVDIDRSTGFPITLGELFAKIHAEKLSGTTFDVEDLTIASLNVKAGKATFNRFDVFNGRYSPLGQSALRSLLLKTDNFIGGRYFAELIRTVFDRQAADGYSFSEYRLSIYGRCHDEWDRLSRWFLTHDMLHPTNRWIVQVPRLYGIYRQNKILSSFEDLLTNIFLPLWQASIDPEKHPFLNYFLAHVSGFDLVDNESERETDSLINTSPSQWTSVENPPFMYWLYYMWANITSLNRYRAARGLTTFSLRPHAGESGDPGHMAEAFLVADGVNHGINLKDTPVLQYLYYLGQIPLGITPLSNNALFCRYNENPFALFFRRGLNVALSTDGALIFHHTEEPLIEEYSTAANYWNLSQVDLCEIAKNSVLMSGFPSYRKKKWLGELYALRSAVGNDMRLTRVPQSRCTFRYEVYLEELSYLEAVASKEVSPSQIMTWQLEGLYTMTTLGLTRDEVMKQRLKNQGVGEYASPVESRTEATTVLTGPIIVAPSRL